MHVSSRQERIKSSLELQVPGLGQETIVCEFGDIMSSISGPGSTSKGKQ